MQEQQFLQRLRVYNPADKYDYSCPESAKSSWPESANSSAVSGFSFFDFQEIPNIGKETRKEAQQIIENLIKPFSVSQWYEHFKKSVQQQSTCASPVAFPCASLPTTGINENSGQYKSKEHFQLCNFEPSPPAIRISSTSISTECSSQCNRESTSGNFHLKCEPQFERNIPSDGSTQFKRSVGTNINKQDPISRDAYPRNCIPSPFQNGLVKDTLLEQCETPKAATPASQLQKLTPTIKYKKVKFSSSSIPDFLNTMSKYDAVSPAIRSTPPSTPQSIYMQSPARKQRVCSEINLAYCDMQSVSSCDFTLGTGGTGQDIELLSALKWAVDSEGRTSLHIAVEYANFELVQFILDFAGELLDSQDVNGDTPLIYSVRKGRSDIVSLLLSKGASCDIVNASGATVSHYAATSSFEIFNMLYTHGSNFDDLSLSDMPLHWAAGDGNLPVVKALLKSGVNVNVVNKEDVTPLLSAALGGHEECVLALLSAGADPSLAHIPGRGMSLLHICCDQGMLSCVRALANTDYGSKCASTFSQGLKPIHSAVLENDDEMVGILWNISGIRKCSTVTDLYNEALRLVEYREQSDDEGYDTELDDQE